MPTSLPPRTYTLSLIESGPNTTDPQPFNFEFFANGNLMPIQYQSKTPVFPVPQYTVIQQFQTATTVIQVMQSLDGGKTWAEMDAAHHPTSGALRDGEPGGYYKLGSNFILFDILNGSTQFRRVITFNLDTLTWGTYTPDSNAGAAAAGVKAMCTWRPNGNYLLVYQDAVTGTLKFQSFNGVAWNAPATLTAKTTTVPWTLWMDDPSGTCTVSYRDIVSLQAFFKAIKSDDSLGAELAVDPTQVVANAMSTQCGFKGRSFSFYSRIHPELDAAVVATDSLSNPTTLSYYTISTRFLDGLANLGSICPLQDGSALLAIWDVADTRIMPDPPWGAQLEMSTLVYSLSADGITWTAPQTLFQPVPTSPYEAGTWPAGGMANNSGGAGAAQLGPISDLGGANVGMNVWRYNQDNGAAGDAIYNLTAPLVSSTAEVTLTFKGQKVYT